MSIVAERVALTQVAVPLRVGSAEENDRGPAPERLSLKEQRRLRGAAIRGNGPGGRVLGRGEDIPLTAEASERLGVLYAEYGAGLVHYARRKLLNRGTPAGVAVHLAEEIAQEAWVEIARTGAKDLLGPDAGARYSADETRWMLWRRVKDRILAHYKRSASYETAVDWEDRSTCAVLCPLLEEVLAQRCQLGALPGYLAPMVAALPEAEREALLGVAYGVPETQACELLKEMGAVGKRNKLIARAVLLLLIDNPELTGPMADPAALPKWQREGLRELSAAQRKMLLRMEAWPREVLLLHLAEGLSSFAIAERLGVSRSRVMPLLSGCAALMEQMAGAQA